MRWIATKAQGSQHAWRRSVTTAEAASGSWRMPPPVLFPLVTGGIISVDFGFIIFSSLLGGHYRCSLLLCAYLFIYLINYFNAFRDYWRQSRRIVLNFSFTRRSNKSTYNTTQKNTYILHIV
ncbi:hypothetical protein J3R30DRAFT_1100702 [Lentinula aciculospora]|uniref:Uncharacterized protein n=1 Tax=Lentinula aciculospora TaxID=153920 RepID=A0A9W9A0B6_9AGAR|nr:hypothetical protein J3R30DRAFT_1100702 [Lentinula aciculospora]